MNLSHTTLIEDESAIGEVRRKAQALADKLGFTPEDQGRVGIIATELASNLVLHAKRGRLLVQESCDLVAPSLELVALDQGPGMHDVANSLADGVSTRGTAGNGLGAIRRLSTEFDVFTRPGLGTAIFSRVAATKAGARPATKLVAGGVCVAMKGEPVSGDGWKALRIDSDKLRLLVADGLGHGVLASEASAAAVKSFETNSTQPLPDLMRTLHTALRGGRGAAVALVEVDVKGGVVRFVGIGNISGSILTGAEGFGLTSLSGIVGVNLLRKVQQFDYAWHDGSVLVLHSDGLGTRWSLDQPVYAGLLARHPTLISAVLYRDFCRGRDDATALVVKQSSRG